MVKFKKPKKLIPKKIEELVKPEKTAENAEPAPVEVQTGIEDIFLDQLSQNESKFRSMYENCSDVIFRSFLIGGQEKATLIYIEGAFEHRRD